MALPNPQEAVRLQGESVVTLKDLLHFQEETNKWSQNTDINTFRAQVDIKKFSEQVTPGAPLATNEGIAKGLKKQTTELSAGEQARIDETIADPLARFFNVVTKPFARLSQNLDGTSFKEFGKGFTNVAAASERANAGFKELTNGIGELGPAVNTFKTTLYKGLAAINVIVGSIQLLTAGFFKAIKFIGDIPDKIGRMFTKDFDDRGDKTAFIDKSQEVMDKKEELDRVMALAPEKVKVQVIEGTSDYYKDLGKAVKSGGHGNLKVGGQQQEKLNLELKQKQEAAEQEYLQARKNAGEKYDKKNAKFEQKLKEKEEKKFRRFQMKQEIKARMKEFAVFMIKTVLPIGLLLAGAIAVVDIFKNKVKELSDAPLAGLQAGFTKAADIAKNTFKNLRGFLGRMFPKMFPKPTTVATTAKPGAPKPGSTAAKEAVKTTLKEGGDDVAKQAAAATGKEMAKTVGKQLVKKIPIIGAGAETALDLRSNEKKFDKIKTAYENQVPIMPDGEGGLRPMTAEEFAAAEQSMAANRAGSAGRGGGALAGATAGAAAGAAIGSVIPVVGTAIGGIIGGVLGGFFGGRAGDKVATDLANKAEGIDDPQEYINMLAQNVPELQNEAGAELAGAQGEVDDMKMASAGGSMSNFQSSSSNTNIDNTFEGSEISMVDQQASYSYATDVA